MFVGIFTDHHALNRYTHPGTTWRYFNIHDRTGTLFDLSVHPKTPFSVVILLFNVDSLLFFFLLKNSLDMIYFRMI